MYNAKAYSVASATSPLAPTTIGRRDSNEHDVQIEILFCGICHSDLHHVRSEWSSIPTIYPCVPGHEIVSRVTKIGSAVTKLKPDELAAVGCMVDSNGTCPDCKAGLERFCPNMTLTFNSPDKYLGGVTNGGYSDSIVVDEGFVLRVPSNLDPAGSAPLLCAGITAYSPTLRWGVTKGKKVGVVGLGGLGHMGVKFARVLGAHVVVFTTSPDKKEDALRVDADEVVVSRNADEMHKHTGSFDFILDTVSADHDINAYIIHWPRNRKVQEMLKNACGLKIEDYTAILLAARTGLRLGELLALEWSDLNWHEQTLEVSKIYDYRLDKTRLPKNKRSRKVDLSPATIEAPENSGQAQGCQHIGADFRKWNQRAVELQDAYKESEEGKPGEYSISRSEALFRNLEDCQGRQHPWREQAVGPQ